MKKSNKLSKEKKVLLSGIITEEINGSSYVVKAVYVRNQNGENVSYPITINCSVSGKMKKNMITLNKGDEVEIEVSLYNIQTGLIVFRKTKKKN